MGDQFTVNFSCLCIAEELSTDPIRTSNFLMCVLYLPGFASGQWYRPLLRVSTKLYKEFPINIWVIRGCLRYGSVRKGRCQRKKVTVFTETLSYF